MPRVLRSVALTFSSVALVVLHGAHRNYVLYRHSSANTFLSVHEQLSLEGGTYVVPEVGCELVGTPLDFAISEENAPYRTVRSRGQYGRLGNWFVQMVNMINYALENCCNIIIDSPTNGGLLPGWSTTSVFFNNTNCVDNVSTVTVQRRCESRSAREWYYGPSGSDVAENHSIHRANFFRSGQCARKVLQSFFKVNKTSALGKSCPVLPYAALQVRSGDIVAGAYNMSTGTYQAAFGLSEHNPYWPHPTAFYVAVTRDIRHRENIKQYVFCEDMGNPTCDFYAKLAHIDDEIFVRSGQSLVDDLHLVLCSQEVATAHSSFQVLLALSMKVEKVHVFSLDQSSSTCTSPLVSTLWFEGMTVPSLKTYWIEDEKERGQFKAVVSPWHNTGLQRFTIDTHRSLASCASVSS